MTGTTVSVPEAVMEKVHAELCRAFLETPEYINKVVSDLMKEPKRSDWQDRDPDKDKPFFERLLRSELRGMIERSMLKALREKYQPAVDEAVARQMEVHQAVEGSLAFAFAKVLEDEWRVRIDTTFAFEKDRT